MCLPVILPLSLNLSPPLSLSLSLAFFFLHPCDLSFLVSFFLTVGGTDKNTRGSTRQCTETRCKHRDQSRGTTGNHAVARPMSLKVRAGGGRRLSLAGAGGTAWRGGGASEGDLTKKQAAGGEVEGIFLFFLSFFFPPFFLSIFSLPTSLLL